jgi:hypothetical protein
MSSIFQYITENAQALLGALGAVVVAARLIVKLTPTPADDTFLDRIVTVLKHVGLHIEPKGPQK